MFYNPTKKSKSYRLSLVFFLLFFAVKIYPVEPIPPRLVDIGITEHLGDKIPQDLVFTNEDNEQVSLSQLMDPNKPTIFQMVYFNCPMLCDLVLSGFTTALNKVSDDIVKRATIITVSIDPNDTAESANKFKEKYLRIANKKDLDESWHFIVGNKDQINQLADTLGFSFNYDMSTDDYAHGAGIFFANAKGLINRYLYGIQYKPFDIKMGILEASPNVINSTVERVLLFCYNYNPDARGYVLMAINIMKAAGLLTLFIVLVSLIYLHKKYRVK